jgi:cytosine/adenosine deaminase-related metal-dependent hydrolase
MVNSSCLVSSIPTLYAVSHLDLFLGHCSDICISCFIACLSGSEPRRVRIALSHVSITLANTSPIRGGEDELLDWLESYTFPTESRFKDLKYAERAYPDIVRRVIAFGVSDRMSVWPTCSDL